MARHDFTKMHALGNDFVIFDARNKPLELTADMARCIADRRQGVGCDQVIVLHGPSSPDAAGAIDIYNADGSNPEVCGNGSACVARLMLEESGNTATIIQLSDRNVSAEFGCNDLNQEIRVDMGIPRSGIKNIPADLEKLGYGGAKLLDKIGDDFEFVFVNMGNPHMVLWSYRDLSDDEVRQWGSKIGHHPMFPQGVNVEFVSWHDKDPPGILSPVPGFLRVRVWERGCGITPACGSGACAAWIASKKKGMFSHRAPVELDGGRIRVEGRADNHVLLSVPTAISFRGSIDLSSG